MLYELVAIVRHMQLQSIRSHLTSTHRSDLVVSTKSKSQSLLSAFLQTECGSMSNLQRIASTAGRLVLSRNGVVRGVTNWGTFLLPKPLRRYQTLHHTGHYFVMRFDSSAQTQHDVQKTLKLDPRLIRYGVVKMGQTLKDISDIGGKVTWSHNDSEGEDRA